MFKFLIRNLIVTLFLLSPVGVFANVVITEVMYDVEGADAGLEWVEIKNTGPSLAIGDYHLFEAGVHHGLIPEGFDTLGSNEYAVIVQDVEKFRSRYGSSVPIIKSSFSLVNTGGEELGISNPDKDIVFSISYDPEKGAAGDGKSLHYGSNGWYSASPTPGMVVAQNSSNNTSSSSSSSSPDKEESRNAATQTSPMKTSAYSVEYYTGYLDYNPILLSQSRLELEAYVVHTKNSKDTKKLGGFYYLSFGDGDAMESDRRITTEHVYRHPGNYTLVFEYYTSRLAYDSGEEPEVEVFKEIYVEDSNTLQISQVDFLGNITIRNNTSKRINLEGWDVTNGVKEYTFPRHTYVDPRSVLVIDRMLHGLPVSGTHDWVVLRNERDYTISLSSIIGSSQSTSSKKISSATLRTSSRKKIIKEETQLKDNTETSRLDQVIPELDHLDQYLNQHPGKEPVSFVGYHNESPYPNNSSGGVPVGWVAGFGLISLVLVGIRSLSKNPLANNDPSGVVGDIELIE